MLVWLQCLLAAWLVCFDMFALLLYCFDFDLTSEFMV